MFSARIMIIEDEVLIAEDLSDIIQSLGYEVVAVCYHPEEAVAAYRKHLPDLVLLDINLQDDIDGIDLASKLSSIVPAHVLYISSYTDTATLARAKITQPLGYIAKPFEEKDIYVGVEIALNNIQRMTTANSTTSGPQLDLSVLTDRELEIVDCILRGLTNKQIATDVFLSVNTIKTHLKNIYEKLDVHTRTELVVKIK